MHANLKNSTLCAKNTSTYYSPCNMTQARDIINELATAMHAMQTTVAAIVGSNSRFSCLCSRYVLESATDY
jgi:hypothetical protein